MPGELIPDAGCGSGRDSRFFDAWISGAGTGCFHENVSYRVKIYRTVGETDVV